MTHRLWQSDLMRTVNRSFEQMMSIDMRRSITKPSDNPAGTEQLVRLRSMMAQNEEYQKNTSSASRWLTYSDSALGAATDCIREIHELALTGADSSNDLAGMAENIDGLIEQMVQIGNSELGGRYLFAGNTMGFKPFENTGTSVIYRGDDTQMTTAISAGLSLRYNVPGSAVFESTEASLNTTVDWDPEANMSTRVSDLFDAQGADLGKIRITDGAGLVRVVDLTGGVTLNDIQTRIQAANPGISVTIVGGERLVITDTVNPGESIRIEDVQGGLTASVFGIEGVGEGGTLVSRNLDPAISDATPLTELRGMALPLGSINIAIGDSEEPTTLDLSGAATVGDIRDTINLAFPQLNVDISPVGNRLNITSSGLVGFSITNVDDTDQTARLIGVEGTALPCRPFDALFDFKTAVESEDLEAIRDLLPEIEKIEDRILAMRASVGTRLKLAEDALSTLEARNFSLTETISEVGDADMAEAIMLYQGAEAIYQASLTMASNIYQLTLANYL
ncbi:MAG: flagellar hook-associated protein 3 [bacterium]|nr:flagellar hook-associated protein 3 [bacterium]